MRVSVSEIVLILRTIESAESDGPVRAEVLAGLGDLLLSPVANAYMPEMQAAVRGSKAAVRSRPEGVDWKSAASTLERLAPACEGGQSAGVCESLLQLPSALSQLAPESEAF